MRFYYILGGAFLLLLLIGIGLIVTATVREIPPASKTGALADRMALFQHVWNVANSQDLTLYGKAIDQNGDPVVGAEVNGYVMRTLGFQGTNETSNVTTTDGSGDFEFRGLKGQSLGIVPRKDGYVFEQRGNGNWTEDYKPSSGKRVIFKMWRLMGADLMINRHLHGTIACDGTVEAYNLRAGHRLVSGNDFTVSLTRKPVNIDRRTPFDWTVTFSMPGGGLISEKDIYPNEAPVSGYQTSITISMPAGAPNWSPSLVQSYYFFNGTAYGRMTIQIEADFQPPPTFFESDIYENPTGRNLEFDSYKQLEQ